MKTFEENIARLEELSDKIRNPEIGIEDALLTFEEGIKLAKSLEKELEKIEGKVQILMNSPLDEKGVNPESIEQNNIEEAANNFDMEEESLSKKSKKAVTTKKIEDKKEFNEEDLQLDLFEEMSAPTEGLRQNG